MCPSLQSTALGWGRAVRGRLDLLCGATSRKRQQKYRKSVKNVGLDFRSVPAEGASGEGASASDVIWGKGTQVAIVIIIAAMNVMSIYGCFIEYVQISHILLVHV